MASSGASARFEAVAKREQSSRQIDHQYDHRKPEDRQIPILQEAKPFRQQHDHNRPQDRAEEAARAADDDREQHQQRYRQAELPWLDEIHQRRQIDAADSGACRTDRKRKQRIGGDVYSSAFSADRVVAQRREGAAPGRAQQPPQDGGEQYHRYERKVEKRQRTVERVAEDRRPRNVGNAEGATGQVFLVAHHKKNKNVESQRCECEVMVLNAQCRKAECQADDETRDRCDGQREPERDPHFGHQDGGDVGTDAVERRLSNRHLPRVADDQIESERRHQIHTKERHQIDAVALEKLRQDGVEHQPDHQRDSLCLAHTLRSSVLPSSPSGLKMMTTRNSISATPSLYAGEIYAPVRFSSTPTSTPPSSAPRV